MSVSVPLQFHLDCMSLFLSQAGFSQGECCSGYKRSNTSSHRMLRLATVGVSAKLKNNGKIKSTQLCLSEQNLAVLLMTIEAQ